jgi:hypothetical protein
MLRKMLTLGAVALVAVAFGVGSATAGNHKSPSSSHEGSSHINGDGFSDGRLAG